MADNVSSEQLEKRTETAEPDPIADSSLSRPLLISSLLLILTLVWSLYDEILGQRPWKHYQSQFVTSYLAYLEDVKKNAAKNERSEKTIKESEEYKKLDAAVKEEEAKNTPRVKEVGERVKEIDMEIADLTDPYQERRAWIASKIYQLETTATEGGKQSIREDIEEANNGTITVAYTQKDGSVQKKSVRYTDADKRYNDLRDRKAQLNIELGALNKTKTELEKKRDSYLQNQMSGLGDKAIDGLINKVKEFKYEIQQINVAGGQVVDRCESCHLGVREPITLTARDMGGEKAFRRF